jgi:hypothetical protein
MTDAEAIRRKQERLAAEMTRYFGETCPALATRWKSAVIGLAPSILQELAVRLRELETVTNQTNLELEAAQVAAIEDHVPAEHLLDRALASMERLSEVAEAMMRWLDVLPKG